MNKRQTQEIYRLVQDITKELVNPTLAGQYIAMFVEYICTEPSLVNAELMKKAFDKGFEKIVARYPNLNFQPWRQGTAAYEVIMQRFKGVASQDSRLR